MSILHGLDSRAKARPDTPGPEFVDALRVAADCASQRDEFEARVGLDHLVDVMSRKVSLGQVTSGIDTYREVIRRNPWMFPTVAGSLADVLLFLDVWWAVHREYHEVAQEIFIRLADHGHVALADGGLYEQVIRSETSRGWVGKRSAIGPDRQIEHRVVAIEELLQGTVSPASIDRLLDVGGALSSTDGVVSAEEDLTRLLTELRSTETDTDTVAVRSRALRDYAKYNVGDLAAKLAAAAEVGTTTTNRIVPPVEDLLATLPSDIRGEVDAHLREIRVLNFVNLNLEPRFSFKSWAGLMHGLVFSAVRALPGMSDDVYGNLSTLKGTK